jgi:hypothetical protein
MALRWGIFERKKKASRPFCSFCGEDAVSVKVLIAGPTASICNECVAECNKCLDGEPMSAQPAAWDQYSDERLLGLLVHSAQAAESAGEFLNLHVDALRKRNVQWAVIGKALGISRQAAWERFS